MTKQVTVTRPKTTKQTPASPVARAAKGTLSRDMLMSVCTDSLNRSFVSNHDYHLSVEENTRDMTYPVKIEPAATIMPVSVEQW